MNNWSHASENRIKAVNHTNIMDKFFYAEIQRSCNMTRTHREKSYDFSTKGKYETKITLIDKDSVSAARWARDCENGKICILNFASYKNPGGKFLEGSFAQEEALCHESFLYNILSKKDDYYSENKLKRNRHLYTNAALYIPEVTFVKKDKENVADFKADVLTCAAPNKGSAMKYENVSSDEADIALYDRIDFLLNVAAFHHAEILILGAFGAGVFKNNPEVVCNDFMKLLSEKYRGCFKHIYFAVPDKASRNHQAFKTIYNG